MKNLISHPVPFSILGAICCIPLAYALGADINSAPAEVPTQAVVTAPAPSAPASISTEKVDSAKLPYGVADVVKLSRSQVSEDVILSYVQNSGIAYSLSPDDIVRLRNEGVSDRVINSMLDQHKKAMEVAQRAADPAPVYRDNRTDSASGYSASETAAAPVQGPVVEAPLTPSGSPAYVIPYRPTTYSAYGYYPYPYYSPYYYGGPVVSFRFGFGGSGRGHFHHRRH